jgi:hypothetical protein
MVRTYRTGWLFLFLFLPLATVVCGLLAFIFLIAFTRSMYLLVADGHAIRHAISLARGLGGLLMGLIAVGFCWELTGLLGRTHTVRISDDGACEFRSPLHRRRLHVSSIASVRADRDDESNSISGAFVSYRDGGYRDRKLELWTPRGGFAELVTQLKQLNPSIAVERELQFGRKPKPVKRASASPPIDRPLVSYAGRGDDRYPCRRLFACDHLVLEAPLPAEGKCTVLDDDGVEIGRIVKEWVPSPREARWELVMYDLANTRVVACRHIEYRRKRVSRSASAAITDGRGREVGSVVRGRNRWEIQDLSGQLLVTIKHRLRAPTSLAIKDSTETEVGYLHTSPAMLKYELGDPRGGVERLAAGVEVTIKGSPASDLRLAVLGFGIHVLDFTATMTRHLLERHGFE